MDQSWRHSITYEILWQEREQSFIGSRFLSLGLLPPPSGWQENEASSFSRQTSNKLVDGNFSPGSMARRVFAAYVPLILDVAPWPDQDQPGSSVRTYLQPVSAASWASQTLSVRDPVDLHRFLSSFWEEGREESEA